MMSSTKEVTIFGAGISGLVAAINLARDGFKVEVCEKRSQIGGSQKWHPSVHQQTFDLQQTAKYIDIDLSTCFQPLKKHIFYFYGRKIVIEFPANSYICEKGLRSSSIESYLYLRAKELGVHFTFNKLFNLHVLGQINTSGKQCIIATGLEQKPYRVLNIRCVNLQGFRSSKTTHDEDFAISYFGKYTNHDFAYLASYKNLLFSLLFARKGVSKTNLEAFQQHLLKSENIKFDEWHFSTGSCPLEKNLVKNNVVLAGTLSGMIDPFYLNGIPAALVSGKIAALFYIDRKKAFEEFKRCTRNFYFKQSLKLVSDKLPIKKISFPLIAQINNRLKCVGII